MAALGELKSPWHNCQMAWLENHLDIINRYSQALENLDSYEGGVIASSRESLLKGKDHYNGPPSTNMFRSAAF